MSATCLIVPKGKARGMVAANFSYVEFDCKCGDSKCVNTLISVDLAGCLDKLRDKVGQPLTLNCAYRCPRHNRVVGGAWHSQHPLGTAADVRLPHNMTVEKLAEAAEAAGFQGIGTYNSFVHVDTRITGPARWDDR